MKVVYNRSIMREIQEAKHAPKNHNRPIEHIILTTDEARILLSEINTSKGLYMMDMDFPFAFIQSRQPLEVYGIPVYLEGHQPQAEGNF